jgi:hypothetical protein
LKNFLIRTKQNSRKFNIEYWEAIFWNNSFIIFGVAGLGFFIIREIDKFRCKVRILILVDRIIRFADLFFKNFVYQFSDVSKSTS